MDTLLLSYRLKSARRKKRLVKSDRDKQLLKLDRERYVISRSPNYKMTVPLAEPYQRGWKRLFVLKPEVARSNEAAFYQEILDKINMVQYHYHESFKNLRRKNRKYSYDLPKLAGINRRDWNNNKHQLSEEQRACFETVDFWNAQQYAMDYHYEFSEPELFVIAVLPHIIDTVIIGDALLEQRIAWIDDYIEHYTLYNRLSTLNNDNRYRRRKDITEKLKYKNPLKNKPRWRRAVEE